MRGDVYPDGVATSDLPFVLDPIELQLGAAGSELQDALNPSRSGSVDRTVTVPATLGLFGLDVRVETALALALGGLAGAAASGSMLLLLLLRASHADEPSRIEWRYRPMLISLRGPGSQGSGEVDVASIEDLARIARRDGGMIAHRTRGGTHDCLVVEAGVTYRHRTSVVPRSSARHGSATARGA